MLLYKYNKIGIMDRYCIMRLNVKIVLWMVLLNWKMWYNLKLYHNLLGS